MVAILVLKREYEEYAMSAPFRVFAVTTRQFEQFHRAVAAARIAAEENKPNADNDWGDVVSKTPDPEDVLERGKAELAADEWDVRGLSFLMGVANSLVYEQAFGPNSNPTNGLVAVSPEEVRGADEALRGFDRARLAAMWDLEAIKVAVIYPESAMEEPGALDRLLDLFDEVTEFYASAASHGWAAIIDFRA